ncbi:MAG TPA: L-threonylcarbamoyladenylate synthase [Chryseolinea sp.]|nr:L-threonylcarbamoyladenylate synthase [Chryseolinea sp.]
MAEIGKDIEKAKWILEQGDLVAIPTETVYGLAGNALNLSSVTKIFDVKNRPHFDPLIIHVPDIDGAEVYAEGVPTSARKLMNQFWPGPLTVLLKRKSIIPDLVTSGLDTVGIRCPKHDLTQQLLKKLPFPLAAPSANPFGYVSPTKPEHVNDQLGDKIKYILDGGDCTIGIESTIVGFESDLPTIYRMGGLSVESLEQAIGKVYIQTHSSSNPKAPGQLKSHYAPLKKVIVGNIEELLQQHSTSRTALLTFSKDFRHSYQFILSPSASMNEAAQNLFTALRELDKMPIDVILAEFVPELGLGKAINDRLIRAAALG